MQAQESKGERTPSGKGKRAAAARKAPEESPEVGWLPVAESWESLIG